MALLLSRDVWHSAAGLGWGAWACTPTCWDLKLPYVPVLSPGGIAACPATLAEVGRAPRRRSLWLAVPLSGRRCKPEHALHLNRC